LVERKIAVSLAVIWHDLQGFTGTGSACVSGATAGEFGMRMIRSACERLLLRDRFEFGLSNSHLWTRRAPIRRLIISNLARFAGLYWR